MEYTLKGETFNLSYAELKSNYLTYLKLSDPEFVERLPEIAHTACFISYIKELTLEDTISDVGVVHELLHLMHRPEETPIGKVRALFREKCKLA